jgi:hypothetical protein
MVSIDNLGNPAIIALANNSEVNRSTVPQLPRVHWSTLGGILAAAREKWESFALAYTEAKQVRWMNMNGIATLRYSTMDEVPEGGCPSYADPQRDVLADLNRAMFIAGIIAGQRNHTYLESHMDAGLADAVNATVMADIVGHQLVFHVDYEWFIAAAVVELICICFIAPTYWKWWQLGRPVSFSPLEIAKVTFPCSDTKIVAEKDRPSKRQCSPRATPIHAAEIWRKPLATSPSAMVAERMAQ